MGIYRPALYTVKIISYFIEFLFFISVRLLHLCPGACNRLLSAGLSETPWAPTVKIRRPNLCVSVGIQQRKDEQWDPLPTTTSVQQRWEQLPARLARVSSSLARPSCFMWEEHSRKFTRRICITFYRNKTTRRQVRINHTVYAVCITH